MRISKESIFTGLNNLRVLSVSDVRFDEYFGFTDGEVQALLAAYGLSDKYGAVKEWYDGYEFGNVNVYCPWDVLNYCDLLWADGGAGPQNYWTNTSSNDIVRRFIEDPKSGAAKNEIEKLVAGETIRKVIRQDLTYKEMYASAENPWSLLYTTGYLTKLGKPEGKEFCLSIPNLEIRDTFVKKSTRENFYHGILRGLLCFKSSWDVCSNRETGDGYSDILVEIAGKSLGIVIEFKYSDSGNLEAGCKEALRQTEERHYEEQLYDDGMDAVFKYGMAFYKKRCPDTDRVTETDLF